MISDALYELAPSTVTYFENRRRIDGLGDYVSDDFFDSVEFTDARVVEVLDKDLKFNSEYSNFDRVFSFYFFGIDTDFKVNSRLRFDDENYTIIKVRKRKELSIGDQGFTKVVAGTQGRDLLGS